MRQLQTDIDLLRAEKAALEEEVRQLRAAIQLYTVVARRIASEAEVARPFAAAA